MVNLTLLLQIIHFWIAYLILDRILLRRVMQLVRTEQLDTLRIKQHVAATTTELARQQQERVAVWHHMQQTLLQQRPALVQPHKLHAKRSELHLQELSAQETRQLAQQLKKVIVDRIAYD